MIAAASIQDQELSIAAKRAGVNNPAVAGRSNLRPGWVPIERPFWVPPRAIGTAEFADFHAIDRQTQMSAHGRKGDRRRKAPGSLSAARSGRVASSAIERASAARFARRPGRDLFELGDEVLKAVGLVRELGGTLPLGVERLLSGRLLASGVVRSARSCAIARAPRDRDCARDDRVRRRYPCARSENGKIAGRARRPAPRISGSTAPSAIAVRTACSASSGRTSSAGGGCRPMRCRAARISTIAARRSSSDCEWRSLGRRAA